MEQTKTQTNIFKIDYRLFSEGKLDESPINSEDILVDNLSFVPSVGDYVEIPDDEYMKGIFKVRSRRLIYNKKPDGSWLINASIGVDRVASESDEWYSVIFN